MKKYILTFEPNFTLGDLKFETDSEEELVDHLEKNGYDTTDEEIQNIILDGGEYAGLEKEFTIEITEESSFAEATDENKEENREEKESSFAEATDENEELEEQSEEEKDNAEIFINEYSNYLIGKEITFHSKEGKDDNFNDVIKSIALGDTGYVLIKTKAENDFILPNELFENFIDGDELELDEFEEIISLVIQSSFAEATDDKEDDKDKKINKSENKYFVIDSKAGKILGGFEYKEDADLKQKEIIKFGNSGTSVVKKSDLPIDLDPENNVNWDLDSHDWLIIEEAISLATKKKEITEDQGRKYLDNFQKGKQISVMKARLIYYLDNIQKQFRQAYINSDIEKANAISEIIERVVKELNKILFSE